VLLMTSRMSSEPAAFLTDTRESMAWFLFAWNNLLT
jgi:hypothetical protein